MAIKMSTPQAASNQYTLGSACKRANVPAGWRAALVATGRCVT